MKIAKIALVLVFAFASGTLQARGKDGASSLEDMLEARNYRRSGAVNWIKYSDIQGWDRLGDRHVIVYAGDSGDFVLRFRRSCKHLDPSLKIRFTASAGNVTTADRITIEWENGQRKFCYITSINRLKKTGD